jgi:hypothetical protein
MAGPARSRSRSFPYRGADAAVTRLAHGWRIAVGTDTADGPTLVDAFETLLCRHVGAKELVVVVAALEWDDTFADDLPAA